MCTMVNAQANTSTAAVMRWAKRLSCRHLLQRTRYSISPSRPKPSTTKNCPGFFSTPKDHVSVVSSRTGTTAKTSVASMIQPMPRAGASRSTSGSSSAFTVMAARMRVGI